MYKVFLLQQLSVITHQICTDCRHPEGTKFHLTSAEPFMKSSKWAERAAESVVPVSEIRRQA